ncbi:MAG: DNA polymerase IV (family X)-like protein [Thermotogota bacterium]|nr:DNA polymerase IV (family X)-like protein [Thermotogota bacterium]
MENSVSSDLLAKEFILLARLMEVSRDNPFKIRTYRFASHVIANKKSDLTENDIKDLSNIKGIGSAVVEKSLEYLETGSIKKIEEIKEGIPSTILKIVTETNIPSSIIAAMWKDYMIDTCDEIIEFLTERRGQLKLSQKQITDVEKALG